MAPDFRLVAHATQRNAGELAAQRVRHAAAQGSLADARRADQTKDRSFQLVFQLDHREKFQQTVFHLAQTVVLLVENPCGGGQVDFVLR